MGFLPTTAPMSDAEWAKVVEAAKKEGTVTCYCWFIQSWRDPWIREAMKKEYGINVEVVNFSGSVLSARIKQETRAGIPQADVFDAVTRWVTAGVGESFYIPLENLPAFKDVSDGSKWYASPFVTPKILDNPIWGTSIGNYSVNTKVVPPERFPKSYQDLLDPFWANAKSCMIDPVSSGGSYQVLWKHFRTNGYPDWWLDWYYDMYNKNSKNFITYLIGTPNPLIRGECGFSHTWTGSFAEVIKNFDVTEKAPWIVSGSFDPVLPAGPAAGYGRSVLAKAPHPNAALVLVNYMYSKEGQASLANYRGVETALRRDVPSPIEEKYRTKNPATKFFLVEPTWWDMEEYAFSLRTLFRLMKEGGMSRDQFKKEVRDTSITFWGQFPPPPAKFFTVD